MPKPDRTPFTLATSWPILLALTAVVATGLRTVTQPTLWMHLSMGRWIHQQGIPRTDPFSLTQNGEPWADFTWLYDLVVYAAHGMGGMTGLTLLHVGIVLAAFWILSRVARDLASPPAIALAILLSTWILSPSLTPGPHTLTLLFPAAYLLILHRPTCSSMSIIVLAGLQVLWINMSPSGVIGPALCLAFLIGAAYRQKQDADEPNAPVMIGIATVVTTLACIINPYGWSALQAGVTDLLSVRPQMASVWISNYAALASYPLPRHLTTAALAVGAGGLLTYKSKLPLGITLSAILGLLCCFSTRNLGLFGILICPFMALSLSAVAQEVIGKREAGPALARLAAPVTVVALAGFTWFAMATNLFASWSGSASRFGLGADPSLVSADAVAALDPFSKDTRILHHPHDAGYLLWTQPERRVAIDARTGFYGTDMLNQFFGAFSGRSEDVQACMELVQPDVVLVNLTWPGAGRLVRGLQTMGFFEPVYVDGTAALLVSITPRQSHTADLPEDRGLQQLEAHRQAVKKAAGTGRFSSQASAMVGAGELFFYLQQWKEAAAAYELVCGTYPNMAEAWFRLGYANLELERPQQAAEALARAVQYSSKDSRIIQAAAEVYDLLGQPEEAERLRGSATDG